MKRRESIGKIAGAALSIDQSGPGGERLITGSPGGAADSSTGIAVSEFANKVLPKVQRTAAGLEPYAGSWGVPQVSHLLRRTMFGAAKADIQLLKQKTMPEAVDLLLTPQPDEVSQPLNVESRDLMPVGQSWVDAIRQNPAAGSFDPTNARISSLKGWWTGLMLSQQLSIREKMVLFLHNHFVTEIADVGEPRFSYRYLALLRKNALGNVKDLTRQVSLDGAMLRYLNGNRNVKTSPNENYARELQELFTIGKGPEVAPGDYTNYTEVDVKAAAKVLTGWRDFTNADGTIGATTLAFDSTKHDTSNKTFSAAYGNTVITGGADGTVELNALLNMIFGQQETAKFICRKLYRWFVYYVIDQATEDNVIVPMANILRSNNYDVLPALKALFKSAHFYDPVNIGCVIKNPMDLAVGLCRQFSVVFPSADVTKQYLMWNYIRTQASNVQLNLGDPPDVAGWKAYYQTPQFYELWISTDTLPRRSSLTNTLGRNGYTSSGATLVIDPIAFVKTLSSPGDPNAIIDESAQLLFPIDVTANQKAFLKNTLLPGLPDYEWTKEWNDYLADPTNAQKLNPVKTKLQALFAFMMSMPEFQLM